MQTPQPFSAPPELPLIESKVRDWLYESQACLGFVLEPALQYPGDPPPEVYIYSDMLQQQGNPRGALLGQYLRAVVEAARLRDQGKARELKEALKTAGKLMRGDGSIDGRYSTLQALGLFCGRPQQLSIGGDPWPSERQNKQLDKMIKAGDSVFLWEILYNQIRWRSKQRQQEFKQLYRKIAPQIFSLRLYAPIDVDVDILQLPALRRLAVADGQRIVESGLPLYAELQDLRIQLRRLGDSVVSLTGILSSWRALPPKLARVTIEVLDSANWFQPERVQVRRGLIRSDLLAHPLLRSLIDRGGDVQITFVER